MKDINRVVIVGRLTKDPELRDVGNTKVCEFRIANNGAKKQGEEYVDKPRFFNVTAWGQQGENVAKYMEKGRMVAVDGELEWREWEHEGRHYEAVSITARSVSFLPDGSGGKRDESAPPVGSTPTLDPSDNPYA